MGSVADYVFIAMSIERRGDWIPLLRHQLQQGDVGVVFTANQAALAIGTTEIVIAMAAELSVRTTGERLFVALYLGLTGRPDLLTLLERLRGGKDAGCEGSTNLEFLGECCNILVSYMGITERSGHYPPSDVTAMLTNIADSRSSAYHGRRARTRYQS
jgi:hypothetical protein